MTLKEKLETIKGKKIAIWCETKEEAQTLVDELNKVTFENSLSYYDEGFTCYSLDGYYETGLWYHSSKGYYVEEDSFQIITYKDFVNNYMGDFNKIHINYDDIFKILDEKYGKDNWVMN